MNQHPGAVNLQARRLMAFVDGENLTLRYEAMLSEGRVPRKGLIHVPGSLVWDQAFCSQFALAHAIVLRATYYTSMVGDDKALDELRDKIGGLDFRTFPEVQGPWPSHLTPMVFKRDKGTKRSKGVDISLTVDVLNHVSRDNVDTVVLFGGDGDYVPLVEEVLRAGKLVFVSAFSSGLNPKLARIASDVYRLENVAFEANPAGP